MVRRDYAALAVVAALLAGACSDPPPPISVSEGFISIHNQTSQDWKNVLITVNDHFRGFFPELKADGRANAAVSQLTTGHGQRWVYGTQVRKIEVKGENPDGTPVTLSWEIGQPKR